MVESFKQLAGLTILLLFLPVAIAGAEPLQPAMQSSQYPELALAAESVLPEEPNPAPTTLWVEVSGYSSTEDQTDSTPCITASGYNVCVANTENIVATNILPLGSQVMFPDLYGDKIFYVEDRMNTRYQNHADLGFQTRWQALNFGRKAGIRMVLVN